MAVVTLGHTYARPEGLFIFLNIYLGVGLSSESSRRAIVSPPSSWPLSVLPEASSFLGSGMAASPEHCSWWQTTRKQSQISGYPGRWKETTNQNTFDHSITALAQSLVRVKVNIVGLNHCLKLTLNYGCPRNRCPLVSQMLVHNQKNFHTSKAPISFSEYVGGGELFLCSLCFIYT